MLAFVIRSKGTEPDAALAVDPQNACFSEDTSASIGRCIRAAAAVGTVTMNVTPQRSTNFQKLSKTPSPLYPCGVGQTTCAPAKIAVQTMG